MKDQNDVFDLEKNRAQKLRKCEMATQLFGTTLTLSIEKRQVLRQRKRSTNRVSSGK